MGNTDGATATESSVTVLEEVALKAATSWGLRPKSLSLIKHRENAVYKLLTDDDRLFALRVHRAGYHSDAALRSEFVWMQALGEAGINVPAFLLRNGTELFASISHEHLAVPRQVDLLHWIDGDQLGSVEEGLVKIRGRFIISIPLLARRWLCCMSTAVSGHRLQILYGILGPRGSHGRDPVLGSFLELSASPSAARPYYSCKRLRSGTAVARIYSAVPLWNDSC